MKNISPNKQAILISSLYIVNNSFGRPVLRIPPELTEISEFLEKQLRLKFELRRDDLRDLPYYEAQIPVALLRKMKQIYHPHKDLPYVDVAYAKIIACLRYKKRSGK